MKPSWMIILHMFYAVTSALSGTERFTPLVSYTLPGSGQLGAFPQSTIDRCAELCLKTRTCISFEFDLFYEICYLSKFNRSHYNLVTSKTRNYYELHTGSKNPVEPNIQEGKNEGFQVDSNVQETTDFEKKRQNLANEKSKDKSTDSSIKEQNWKNGFLVNPAQTSSKADASLSENPRRFPDNSKISLNGRNVAASGAFEDGKAKGSFGRNNEDSQDNLINDRSGQEHEFRVNGPTSFDDGNRNLPSGVNTGRKENGIVQESPHLTQKNFFTVETTKKNRSEDGFQNVRNNQGHLPFLSKGQGGGEIVDARSEGPSAALNGNSRDFQRSGNFYYEAPREPQDHTPSSDAPPIYPVSPDPCRDGSLKSYPYTDSCAAYWRCEAARSVAGCCAEGYAYVEGSGCLPNVTCINECSGITDYTRLEVKAKDQECHLKPFHEDRRYYLEFVPGHGMRPRPCSAGTIYNHTRCQCVIGSVEVTECEPEFFLDFNNQIADKSRNGLPLTVFGVYPQQGAGVFNNDSHIKIWRFADAHIGNKLTIHIMFKDTGSHRNQIEYLMSNCYQYDRQKTSSVALALNWRTREILMLIDTNQSEPKVLRLKYMPNQWENVTLNYDGETFQARLGQTVSEKITLQGEIEPRPSGFVVGNCGHFPSFTGLIKEVKIYLCNPRSEKLMDRR